MPASRRAQRQPCPHNPAGRRDAMRVIKKTLSDRKKVDSLSEFLHCGANCRLTTHSSCCVAVLCVNIVGGAGEREHHGVHRLLGRQESSDRRSDPGSSCAWLQLSFFPFPVSHPMSAGCKRQSISRSQRTAMPAEMRHSRAILVSLFPGGATWQPAHYASWLVVVLGLLL